MKPTTKDTLWGLVGAILTLIVIGGIVAVMIFDWLGRMT